ncbi:MAG: hypothetical protein HQK54_12320, partial [Oligoflexales bacterium]|nr:hypothetical protein [Oligoflexales bacterium]
MRLKKNPFGTYRHKCHNIMVKKFEKWRFEMKVESDGTSEKADAAPLENTPENHHSGAHSTGQRSMKRRALAN